jgi:hypothetical protein
LLTIKALNRNQFFIKGRLMPGARAAIHCLLAAPASPGGRDTTAAAREGWF